MYIKYLHKIRGQRCYSMGWSHIWMDLEASVLFPKAHITTVSAVDATSDNRDESDMPALPGVAKK